MKKSLIMHGALAVVSVGLAAMAWTEPQLRDDDGSVVVVGGDAQRLTSITWRDEQFVVTVEQKAKDEVAVSVQDVGAAEGAVERRFPGSEAARSLMEKLVPLSAGRALGKVSGASLEAMGFGEASSKLVVRFGQTAHELEVGNATYGTGDLYVRAADGNVYLVGSSVVAPLRYGGSSLLNKSALAVPREKISRVAITAGKKSRELVQRYGEDESRAFLADPAVPDERLDEATRLLGRVLKMRIVDLAKAAPVGPPKVTVELRNGEVLGKVEIWEAEGDEALARTSSFAQPVTLSSAQATALVREAEAVVSKRN